MQGGSRRRNQRTNFVPHTCGYSLLKKEMIISLLIILILVLSCAQGFRSVCTNGRTSPVCLQCLRSLLVDDEVQATEELKQVITQVPALIGAPSNSALVPNPTGTEVEVRTVLSLLFAVAVLNNIDRVSMAVSIIPMSTVFSYDSTQKSLVAAAFSLGYLSGILPSGYAGTVSSPKAVMATGVAMWSLATMAAPTAAMSSFNTLLFSRCLMGASESVTIPLIQTFISRFSPREQRTTHLALVFSGLNVGSILAFLVTPLILERFGWEGPFYGFGSLGFFWLAIWWAAAKDYPSAYEAARGGYEATAAAATSVVSEAEQGDQAVQIDWKAILRDKNVQAITAAHMASNVGLYFMLNFLPIYCNSMFQTNVQDSASFAILPAISSGLSGLLGGRLADYLIVKGWDKTVVRKIFQTMAFVVPAGCLLYLGSQQAGSITETGAILAFAVATGFSALSVAGYSSGVQDVCRGGSKLVPILYSATSAPAVLAGSAGIYGTGKILDNFSGNFDLILRGIAAVYLAGAMFYAARYSVPAREELL